MEEDKELNKVYHLLINVDPSNFSYLIIWLLVHEVSEEFKLPL